MKGVARAGAGRGGIGGTLLLTLAFSTTAAAQPAPKRRWPVRYGKAVEIPVQRAETITIVNRLGSVEVSAWDRPAVRVLAIKQAASAEVGERLRAVVQSEDGKAIEVKTYVRVRSSWTPALRRTLRRLLLRHGRLLEQALASPEIRSLRVEAAQIQAAVEALVRRKLLQPPSASELSLPVAPGRLDLRLRVPRAMAVKVETFRHKTTIRGCEAGVVASSEEGVIDLRRIKGGVTTWAQRGAQHLEGIVGTAMVSGGDSDVALIGLSGPVKVSIFSGLVDLRRLGARRVQVDNLRGRVRLGQIPRGGRYRVRSRDGEIEIMLRPLSALRFEADVRSVVNRVGAEIDRQGTHYRGYVGDPAAGGLLIVKSRRGGLTLTPGRGAARDRRR